MFLDKFSEKSKKKVNVKHVPYCVLLFIKKCEWKRKKNYHSA